MSRSGRVLETDVFSLTEGKPEPALCSLRVCSSKSYFHILMFLSYITLSTTSMLETIGRET